MSPRPDPEPQAIFVRPETVIARAPYMGLSCPRPNSIACDRIGLAVGLRRPARRVTATIGSRSFALDAPAPGPDPTGVRRAFEGFLQPAGLRGPGPLAVQVENGRNRWTGRDPVSARVRLAIEYADGSRRVTELAVQLAAGWG